MGGVGGGYEIDVLGGGFADGGTNEVEFYTSATDMDGTRPRSQFKAAKVTTVDDNHLKVVMPKFLGIGWVDVVVRNTKGESRLARGFDITQEDNGRSAYDLYVDRSVTIDGVVTYSGGAEVGIDISRPVDSSFKTSIHIDDNIEIPQADIRIDTAKSIIFFKPGKRDSSMVGYHSVSLVHGPNQYVHAHKALLYTAPALGPAHTVSESEAVGLSLRLYPVSRRRRRVCGFMRGRRRPSFERVVCPNGDVQQPGYAFRALRSGDKHMTLPMEASNGADNAGHLPDDDGDFEFIGASRPFKITAEDGTPCKTVRQTGGHDTSGHTLGQRCMSMPPTRLIDVVSEIRPGSELFFWNEKGQFSQTTVVDEVKPNTHNNKPEWSPGDTTLIFREPFSCAGGVHCSFGVHSWVSVVPQFKELTVPKGALLTAAQGVCKPSSTGAGKTCFNEPPLLTLDVDGPLRVDGSIDMTGTASQCLSAANSTSRGNFGTFACGAGGSEVGAAGTAGGENPSDGSTLRTGSCGGSGSGASAHCWRKKGPYVATKRVCRNYSGRRRYTGCSNKNYHAVDEGWDLDPASGSALVRASATTPKNQPGRCKWRSDVVTGNGACTGTLRADVIVKAQQDPFYGPALKTSDDWNRMCKHSLGYGGDGGNGGGIIVIKAKSVRGSGFITSNGEPGAQGAAQVKDIDPSYHTGPMLHTNVDGRYDEEQKEAVRVGCYSDTPGGNGGSGSGGAILLDSPDVGASVLITATPGGKVHNKRGAWP